MISRIDIEERVREWELREDVVEKDYVLDWLLWGIGSDPELSEQWAFKGGTCLKKCYLETYRFSEDLDFTVLPGGPVDSDAVLPILERVLDHVGEQSGINFAERPPRLRTLAAGRYTEGRVYYIGPRQSPMVASVKLDISGTEIVARPTVLRSIAHPYPDDLPDPGTVRCYAYEEVFAEKIRAMGERGRPRDLYDIVNLFRREDLRDKRAMVHEVLVEKCHTKGVPVPTLALVEQADTRAELEAEWENMLGHQLPATPPFTAFWSELAQLFAWLDGKLEPVAPAAISAPSAETVDVTWSPPRTISMWGARASLELIRFAAANRLCIELGYNGSRRVIEPYSLRRSQDGNLLLYAVRSDSREPRSYRVDRIESVLATNKSYTPVYRVELDTIDPALAPAVATTPAPLRVPRRRSSAGRAVYIIECPYCHKEFRRKRNDTRLRPHKTPEGYLCSGRGHGRLLETRYE